MEETNEAATASGADIEGEAAGWAKLERALVLVNAVGLEKGFHLLMRDGVVAVGDFSGLHGDGRLEMCGMPGIFAPDDSQRTDCCEQEGDDAIASTENLPCNQEEVGQDFKMAGRGWAGRRT